MLEASPVRGVWTKAHPWAHRVKVPLGSNNAASVGSSCVATRATEATTRFGDGPRKGHGEKLNHERLKESLLVRAFGDGAESSNSQR